MSDVTIPISYNYQVQSLIYSILAAGGNCSMHDERLEKSARNYKFFTFGRLLGGTVCSDKKHLHFNNEMFLEVRSVRDDFCTAFEKGLESEKSFRFFDNNISVKNVKVDEKSITYDTVKIRMISPVSVHITDENKYRRYPNPLDSDFSDEISKNFIRKYMAFFNEVPSDGIKIKAVNVGASDRRVSLYKRAYNENEKDYYITGWTGCYELTGRSEYLTFLYYCGLGANNSDGFGMFEFF